MPPIHFIIRDALATDIPSCLALDHTYTSDYVWQMALQADGNGWRATFRTERLPRSIESTYPITEQRLDSALEHHGLLVAANKDDQTLLGYLCLRHEPLNEALIIRDLVVSRPFRRAGVGTRLFNIARRWAQQGAARTLIAETQTNNYPAIQFFQRFGLAFCGFNDKLLANHEIAVYFGQDLR